MDFLADTAMWETETSTAEGEVIITGPGTYDLVVVDAPLEELDAVVGFCRDMRDNQRLFNLPFLVRVPGLDKAGARDLYRAGVSRVIDVAGADADAEIEAPSLIARQRSRNVLRHAVQPLQNRVDVLMRGQT